MTAVNAEPVFKGQKLTLAGHLSALYAKRHGLRGGGLESEFIDELKADPAMLAEAKKRRAELVDNVVDKCYVSRVHRDILDSALAKVGNP